MQTKDILTPHGAYYQVRCFQNVCCSMLSHTIGRRFFLFVHRCISVARIMPVKYLLRKWIWLRSRIYHDTYFFSHYRIHLCHSTPYVPSFLCITSALLSVHIIVHPYSKMILYMYEWMPVCSQTGFWDHTSTVQTLLPAVRSLGIWTLCVSHE